MGGQIEWAALPTIAALLGVDDIEQLAFDLAAIRNSRPTDET